MIHSSTTEKSSSFSVAPNFATGPYNVPSHARRTAVVVQKAIYAIIHTRMLMEHGKGCPALRVKEYREIFKLLYVISHLTSLCYSSTTGQMVKMISLQMLVPRTQP